MDRTDLFVEFPTLEELGSVDIGRACLLIVDVQCFYCDPSYSGLPNPANTQTLLVANHIADDILPMARDIGLRPVFVYSVEDYGRHSRNFNQPDLHCGGFFRANPLNGEMVSFKQDDSAFKGTCFEETLRNENVDTLFIVGVNAAACVRKTVKGALEHKFNVCVLEDGVANGDCKDFSAVDTPKNICEMQQDGAVISSSKEVLAYLSQLGSPS